MSPKLQMIFMRVIAWNKMTMWSCDHVIMKLMHRKRMWAVIKSCKKLNNEKVKSALKIGRVFIVESWFFNGNINVQLEEKGDRHHISHVADILDLLDISEDDLNEIVKKKY